MLCCDCRPLCVDLDLNFTFFLPSSLSFGLSLPALFTFLFTPISDSNFQLLDKVDNVVLNFVCVEERIRVVQKY